MSNQGRMLISTSVLTCMTRRAPVRPIMPCTWRSIESITVRRSGGWTLTAPAAAALSPADRHAPRNVTAAADKDEEETNRRAMSQRRRGTNRAGLHAVCARQRATRREQTSSRWQATTKTRRHVRHVSDDRSISL